MAEKKVTSVMLSEDVLDEARREGINLSQVLEERLVEILREKRRQRWLEENREAIESFNEHIRRNGLFSDDYRTF